MLALLLATLLLAYFIYAAQVLDLHKPALEALCKPVADWFAEAGNSVTALLWTVVGILLVLGWFGSEESIFYKLQGEITGMAFTVIVIDWLVGYRNRLQEKKRIIRQMSSRSNDFALDAARIIVEEGWEKDGSLKNIELKWANLQKVYLLRAKLSNILFHFVNLENARLDFAQLDGARFVRCNLQKIWLISANLTDARFYNIDFRGAILKNIKAKGAKFNNVALEDASVKSANLEGAEFVLSSLKNADLASANLRDADLKSVAYLETANLKNALYNADTIFPDGFSPEAAGAIRVDE